METLSELLQPYKSAIGFAASIVTIGQFFSGISICLDIRKQSNTKGISSLNFVGGLIMGLTMLQYGLLLGDPAMLRVNLSALFINVCYIFYYFIYSTDKWEELLKPLAYGMAVVAVLWGYCLVESSEKIEYRYGFITTAMMFFLLSAPLFNLKKIIKEKDASSIPFVPIACACLVTFLWLLYAIILLNYFMIFQNVVGSTLCAIQIILTIIYPKKTVIGKKKTKKDN